MNDPKVAFISFHASPLAAPGEGKAGGMNVYVRQLALALGNIGVAVDIFTRKYDLGSGRELDQTKTPGRNGASSNGSSPDGHKPGPSQADGVSASLNGSSPNNQGRLIAPVGGMVGLGPGEEDDRITYLSDRVRVIRLPAGEADASLDELYPTLPHFLAEMERFQEDYCLSYTAVHSHYWLSSWLGRAFSGRLDLPHIVTFHTLARIKMQSRAGEQESQERQQVEEELLSSADRIIAFSPHEREAMVRLYGADAERIQLAPCGVDLSAFRPLDREESRKRLGLNGEKVLLYVGRIESLKGVELLVHTVAHMDTCEPVQALVVGDDNGQDRMLERVRQLAQTLEVAESFHFVGRVAQEELPIYYSAADVCVVPSFYESFGLAALESMACGTPVVASRVGGLASVIRHGSTGYLKSWRCPEAFANSLEMLISSESLQGSMGRAARRRAEELSWDKVASQIAALYQTLANEKTAAPGALPV